MKKLIAVLIIVLAPFPVLATEQLCPANAPVPKDSDDLRMYEGQFNEAQAASSLNYLGNRVPERLNEPNVARTVESSEFWISYANSLKFVEGYMLRQEALLERAQNKEYGTKSKKALNAFCSFISTAEYVD